MLLDNEELIFQVGSDEMNIEALYIAFSIFVAIMLAITGLQFYNRREIEVNRFKPNYDKEEVEIKPQKNHALSSSKRILLIISGGLTTGVLVYAVVGNLIMAFISSFAGFFFPGVWFKWYTKNQEKLVSGQFEKAAEIMAAVIKTENNMVAALERAASDNSEPLRSKLNKTAKEISLGIPPNKAFESLARSVNVPEILIISVGIDLQQKGMAINMSSMLEQVQKNIRNRQALRDELNVMTTENKIAGWVVAAIPFATLALFRLINPEFVAPLFNTTVGLAIFAFCFIVIALGLYWLLQIAEMKET